MDLQLRLRLRASLALVRTLVSTAAVMVPTVGAMKPPTTLAALTADPQNRRTHDARNLDAIASSLKAVGAARSIVIDEDNLILAGNGVTQAAQSAGLKKLRIVEADGDEVIAVRRRGLTPEQKRALALYDNRTAELATWNIEQLLADQAAGLDLGAWWTDEELAALLNSNGGPKAGLTDPDAVPAKRNTSKSSSTAGKRSPASARRKSARPSAKH